jgi:ADP-heptose:LPS heptosyltransferase
MKIKSKKYPLNEFLKRKRILSIIINSVFSLFFFIIRKINWLFSFRDGHVVVIALHRLGDTIFSIPAVSKIIERYGSKTIIVCFSTSVPIYKLAFTDVEFCTVERSDFFFNERIANFKIKQKLRALKPYIILDISGTMISSSLIFNMRARKIIGINGKLFRMIYDQFVLYREKPKLVDIYLDAISPVIQIRDRNKLYSQSIALNPNGKILIHPYAGWKEKEWNFRKFFILAEKLSESFDVCIIAPTNYIDTDIIQEIMYSPINIIQTKSSDELIQAIKECAIFIGNDSGPINIANFLGKPTVTIFGATNPDYTASDYDFQKYTQVTLECSAREKEKYCLIGADAYHCPGLQCMNLLTLDEVYKNVLPLINKYCSK